MKVSEKRKERRKSQKKIKKRRKEVKGEDKKIRRNFRNVRACWVGRVEKFQMSFFFGLFHNKTEGGNYFGQI